MAVRDAVVRCRESVASRELRPEPMGGNHELDQAS
jgi:hypothetical protein